MTSSSQLGLAKGYTFTIFTMTSIVISFFPLYFDAVGYSKLQIGMLYAIGPMIGIVSNLLWGYISDRWGTIRKVLLLLTGQLIMAPLVFHAESFGLLYAAMAVFFFFQQPMLSMNDSQLLLITSVSGKSYASFRVYGSIGFAFASLVFGMILKETGHTFTAYLAYGSVIASLLFAFLLRDVRGGKDSFKPIEWKPMAKIIGSRPFLRFLGLLLILSIAHRINDGFLALYMRELHAPDSLIGYAWTASALSEIPTFFLLSKYGHKFKELALLAVAASVYMIRFTLLSFIQDPVWAIALQAMHSMSFGIFLFTGIRYVSQAVPDEYRASGQAIFAVTWQSVAGLISGVIGGWLFEAYGGQWLYRIAALLALAAAVGFFVTHWYEENGSPRKQLRKY
ncbi:MFS transporter [Paenibacillus chartarius]|uniref:MFS transporter n=1 Tax=Paenibacillus chartarius TaxID=747481 RepID=A0ABV6DUU0_9BACL